MIFDMIKILMLILSVLSQDSPEMEPMIVIGEPIQYEIIAESNIDILQIECEDEMIEEIIYEPYSDEVKLIALITMAEAEGESILGKRLVIDTILNRVEHDSFPDTIYDVIYQKNAFSSVWNGRVDRCTIDNDICDLVLEELQERTNEEVIFFSAKQYSSYGVPLFVEGNHCFSSY